MFEGFKRVWTAVAPARSLKKAPLGVTVAGTPVALFRDGEGRARGLVDRCPHRGVKLSLGRVENGCLTCPFHGWKFDGDGRCVSVPWNPDAKRETLGGWPVPVQERGGLLWIFTEAGRSEVDDVLHVPPVLLRTDVTVSTEMIRWNTHWSRAMENMLDWPHLPFVHGGTIGRGMAGQRMDISWEDTDSGGTTRIRIDGVDQPGQLDYLFPNAMVLAVMNEPRRTMNMFVSVIPVDDTATDMLLCTARSFLRPRLFDPLFRMANRRIAGEDRAVIESSFPVAVPPAAEERSVRTDQPTLVFRKRYMELIAGDADNAPAPRRGALRVLSDASSSSSMSSSSSSSSTSSSSILTGA
jgi:phenylpropionate dioxygenase-like ring-hydroxylating dioxygenase large terminal subunit